MRLKRARIWRVEAAKIGPKTGKVRQGSIREMGLYSTEREAKKEAARLRQKGLWARAMGWDGTLKY